MYKLVFSLLLLFIITANAKSEVNFATVDSVSYQLYMEGNWDKLLQIGTEALQKNIDFKNLRKRMGYAFFCKGDYYASHNQYYKAYQFDKADADSKIYLYYCGLYLGDEVLTRYYSDKLTVDEQLRLNAPSAHQLLSAVDVEYNRKYNSDISTLRSNPIYYRVGVKTQINNRLSLYQSVSLFQQSLSQTSQLLDTIVEFNRKVKTDISIGTKQFEYYSLLGIVLSENLKLNVGYHYLNTNLNLSRKYALDSLENPALYMQAVAMTDSTIQTHSNMFFAKLSTNVNRFTFGLSGSYLNSNNVAYSQFGLHAGVKFEGKANVYYNNSIYKLSGNSNNRFVVSQSLGGQISKPLWIEANVTVGNLYNFNDFDGLYVYNSVDPTVFKTGVSLYYNYNPHLTFVGNLGFDIKEFESESAIKTNYNQQSLSGGIIWKF